MFVDCALDWTVAWNYHLSKITGSIKLRMCHFHFSGVGLLTGSYGGCVHWTPSFLVDLFYHFISKDSVSLYFGELFGCWSSFLFCRKLARFICIQIQVYQNWLSLQYFRLVSIILLEFQIGCNFYLRTILAYNLNSKIFSDVPTQKFATYRT
jgi:hypothetical protein